MTEDLDVIVSGLPASPGLVAGKAHVITDPARIDEFKDGEILVTVSDQGDGIPEKDIPHIFERNFSGGRRIQTSTSGKGNSGLGLYISRQIISQHSGRISAKNNPGGGAALSFSLPYYR